MADAETRGGRLCLEIIIIVQKRDDEAESQVDLGKVCVCVWGGQVGGNGHERC